MNTELLLKVRDKILATPEEFDMDDWTIRVGRCGTTHCIGGWALIMSGGKITMKNRRRTYLDAAEALCIEANHGGSIAFPADRLFLQSKWPKKYRVSICNTPKQRAINAAQRIDHFILTNGEE